jgi:dihydrofolate synthase/folylpolyglutamate synthase
MSLLTFADKVCPSNWDRHDELLAEMDLQGEYQCKNLRTVLAALDVLASGGHLQLTESIVMEAIRHTARRTGFRGRWDKVSDNPYIICDIGHNEHGLRHNFAQLERMLFDGSCSDLIVVYGSVADKDVDAVLHLMPADATYIFTQAQGKRALAAEKIRDRYLTFCAGSGRKADDVYCRDTVVQAVELASRLAASLKEADKDARPLIYIGGSTYVVSEAMAMM